MTIEKEFITLNCNFPDLVTILLSRNWIYKSPEGNFYECTKEFEEKIKEFIAKSRKIDVEHCFDYEYYFLSQYLNHVEDYLDLIKLSMDKELKRQLALFKRRKKIGHWTSEELIGFIVYYDEEDSECSSFTNKSINALFTGDSE